MSFSSGHTPEILTGKELARQTQLWRGYSNGLVRLDPGKWLFPADYTIYADKLYNFQLRSNDVFVMTWPKCGTTWMQEILWTMRKNPDLKDPDRAKPINVRVPFLDTDMFERSDALPPPDPNSSIAKEFERLCPEGNPDDGLFLQLTDALPSPRTIKTHMPLSLLPSSLLTDAKVVYVARNPKDVVVSYHHHCRLFKAMGYAGTFEQFVKEFLNDDLVYGPYWLHVKEAWEKRDHPNLHFVFYEDLKGNIMTELKSLNTFLGSDLTKEQLQNVCEYTKFENMKARDNLFKETKEQDLFTHQEVQRQDGGFYRKGKSSGGAGMKLASGHQLEEVSEEELAHQQELWGGYTNGLVRLNPGRWLFPIDFKSYADNIYNFQLREDDVFIVTWPKCGTTWMQEILWTMRNNPDLKHPDGRKAINLRVPFVDTDMFLKSKALPPPDPNSSIAKEFGRLCPNGDPSDAVFLQLTDALGSPRTIKSHMPFSLLPPSLLNNAKVVYVARNPKDVVVSYHHHCRLFTSMGYKGTFDQYVKEFLNDDLVYGPYWLHVKEAWERRENPNLHFLFYEDMKHDIMTELKALNTFLDTGLNEEQLQNVCEFTKFENMKERNNTFKDPEEEDSFSNQAVLSQDGGFYRKGETGNWKVKLSLDQSAKIDDWTEKHLGHTGIKFKDSL